MRTAIIGAGAMGSVFGAQLAEAGHDVTLVDVAQPVVDSINAHGLIVDDKAGVSRTIRVAATTDPASVGPVDLAVIFVKCYHTEAAVRRAEPLIGPDTAVLSLQNGWGNAPRIGAIVGDDRVLAGITYNSATVLGLGHVQHTGLGPTVVGELNRPTSARLERIVAAIDGAGLPATAAEQVITEIWKKLALNVCSLPASALLRFYAGQLVEHDGTLELMRALLRETVSVAQAQQIPLDEAERWEVITSLLKRAAGAKASMLQDIEARRRTEIDVVNGAIVDAGDRLGLPTPHNQTMVWMVKALEETFVA